MQVKLKKQTSHTHTFQLIDYIRHKRKMDILWIMLWALVCLYIHALWCSSFKLICDKFIKFLSCFSTNSAPPTRFPFEVSLHIFNGKSHVICDALWPRAMITWGLLSMSFILVFFFPPSSSFPSSSFMKHPSGFNNFMCLLHWISLLLSHLISLQGGFWVNRKRHRSFLIPPPFFLFLTMHTLNDSETQWTGLRGQSERLRSN